MLGQEEIEYYRMIRKGLDGGSYKPLTSEDISKINETVLRIIEEIGCEVNSDKVIKTFELVNMQKDIDFEIRTTYVEILMKPKDIHKILAFLKKNSFRGSFVLQQYQYSEGVGDEGKDKFKKPEHITLLDLLEPYKNSELPFKIFLRESVNLF